MKRYQKQEYDGVARALRKLDVKIYNSAYNKVLYQRPYVKARYKVYSQKPEVKLKNRGRNLKRQYGITMEQKEQMRIAQNNRCASCGNLFKNWRDVCIDHNHTTGEVRTLLCRKCNAGVGCFDEDINKLQKAINYLEKYQQTECNISVRSVIEND